MFTCPERDIHSVYLDGELPQSYVRDYEVHVAACPECRKVQQELIMLGSSIEKDRKSMDFSKEDVDQSFDRLMTKLSYKKVVERSHKKRGVLSFVRYGAVAAAAAFAVLFALPSTQSGQRGDIFARFTPVSNAGLTSPSNQGIVIDGALDAGNVVSLFGGNSSEAQAVRGSSVSNTHPIVHLNQASSYGRNNLASYDIFMDYPVEKRRIPSFERYKSSYFHYYSSISGITMDMDE